MVRKSVVSQWEELLTTAEVAALLNVNVSTVRRWSDNTLLPSYRIGTRGDRRFRRVDVQKLLKEVPARKAPQLAGI